MENAAVAERPTIERAGKYLTFKLGEEEYGLEILKVRTIIELMAITPVPHTPHFVKGVINLRGQIIPIADLRLKFGMSEIEETHETVIIVVEVVGEDKQNVDVGIMVDSVSEVLDINGDDIEDAPTFGGSIDSNFILGMAKAKGSVKILLNIDQVLSGFSYAAMV